MSKSPADSSPGFLPFCCVESRLWQAEGHGQAQLSPKPKSMPCCPTMMLELAEDVREAMRELVSGKGEMIPAEIAGGTLYNLEKQIKIGRYCDT